MLILTWAKLSGVHMSTVSFLLIWIRVNKASNIRLGYVASFQPSRSATIQYAHSNWFNTILYPSLPCMFTVWRIIFVGSNFRGKSEKALKIDFHGFKFRDNNQSRGVVLLHKR